MNPKFKVGDQAKVSEPLFTWSVGKVGTVEEIKRHTDDKYDFYLMRLNINGVSGLWYAEDFLEKP